MAVKAGLPSEPPAEVLPAVPGAAAESGAVTPACKCGAGPHEAIAEICARGHAMPGNSRTLTTGLHSARVAAAEVDDEVADPSAWAGAYRLRLRRHITRLSQTLDARPGIVRSLRLTTKFLELVKEARALDRELSEAPGATPGRSQYAHLSTEELEAECVAKMRRLGYRVEKAEPPVPAPPDELVLEVPGHAT